MGVERDRERARWEEQYKQDAEADEVTTLKHKLTEAQAERDVIQNRYDANTPYITGLETRVKVAEQQRDKILKDYANHADDWDTELNEAKALIAILRGDQTKTHEKCDCGYTEAFARERRAESDESLLAYGKHQHGCPNA